MGKTLNSSAHAASLIAAGRITDSASWTAPSSTAEDACIKSDGMAGFGRWHLGTDAGMGPEMKGRYSFPFTSDFKTVNYAGLRACITRAAQAGYSDIEKRARELYDAAGKKLGKRDASAEATIDLPMLTLRGSFAPATVDPEKRTAEMVWTTGARVKRGVWEPYWEELSLDPAHVRMQRLNNGAPLLDSHQGRDTSSVLGVVESARLEKGKGTATVRFPKAGVDPQADRVFEKVRDGILQNVSVGYRVYKLEQVEDGRARDDKTPVLRAVDWEPRELSVVPIGADDGAGFRSAEARGLNPCIITRSYTEFPAPEENRTMAGETQPTTPATPATPAAAAPSAAQQEIHAVEAAARAADTQRRTESAEAERLASERAAAAVRAERERVAEIRSLVRRTDLGEEFAERLVREGASIDAVRAAVLNHLAARSDGGPDGHIRIAAGDDVAEKFVRGACASIFQRAGTSKLIEGAQKNPLFAEQFKGVVTDPGEFRGMKLIDLARTALEMRGVPTKGLHGEALIKRALSYRDAGMNTSSDFTVLLETAVNKTFLGAYAYTPVTWRRWCGVKSVQDFRTSTFYRPGAFGVLDSVSESGEVKHKNIPDGEKATISPSTKGNIIGLTRRAMVNDDMGVFRDLAGGLGTAAALTIESTAFALITGNSGLGANYPGDTHPLFYSTRNNIGASGALSVTTLDNARAVMAKQKDPNSSMYLNLRPSIWLGPVELAGQARVFNENATDPSANLNGVTNRVRGMFSDVVDSAFLSASSATRHYLLADPALYAVFAVAFIDGQESPTVTSEQSFEYDGVQIKIVMDFGVAIIDYRGAVTCPGA
jgi:hypothetical protein